MELTGNIPVQIKDAIKDTNRDLFQSNVQGSKIKNDMCQAPCFPIGTHNLPPKIKLLHFGDAGRRLHPSNLTCSFGEATQGLLHFGFVSTSHFLLYRTKYTL